MVATHFDGLPLSPTHGGPARLLVPHLYFWKSAKWIRRIVFHEHDSPGFWESLGYHIHGDPWREPRYDGDRSEEHTSELQSLMRISYAVFCLQKKKTTENTWLNHT